MSRKRRPSRRCGKPLRNGTLHEEFEKLFQELKRACQVKCENFITKNAIWNRAHVVKVTDENSATLFKQKGSQNDGFLFV